MAGNYLIWLATAGLLASSVQAAQAPAEPAQTDEADASAPAESVSLRQRVWPMIEMLRRAHAAGEPVVWGV